MSRSPYRATRSTTGSWSTARLASASACSGPAGHMNDLTMARDESNDAAPSGATRSNAAASTIVAHRSASVELPLSTAVQVASTASGG